MQLTILKNLQTNWRARRSGETEFRFRTALKISFRCFRLNGEGSDLGGLEWNRENVWVLIPLYEVAS